MSCALSLSFNCLLVILSPKFLPRWLSGGWQLLWADCTFTVRNCLLRRKNFWVHFYVVLRTPTRSGVRVNMWVEMRVRICMIARIRVFL